MDSCWPCDLIDRTHGWILPGAEANDWERKNRKYAGSVHRAVFGAARMLRLEELSRSIQKYTTAELYEIRNATNKETTG